MVRTDFTSSAMIWSNLHISMWIANDFRPSSGSNRSAWRAISVFVHTNFAKFKRSSQNIKEQYWRLGMGTLALGADERVADVEFTKDTLSVALIDGRTITVPLAWYPRLLAAKPAQRRNWKIAGGGYGLHWPDIDEDLTTEGLLRGAPAPRVAVRNKKPSRRR